MNMMISMKKYPVRKTRPFTRVLAAVLAILLIRSSTPLAAAPVPGSLAVLEPSIALPEMRAAWDGISSGIYLDPFLLAKGREEVSLKLEEWSLGSSSIRSAYQTADRITLDRAKALIEQAWALYYRFDYREAAGVLEEARELLATPGDSGFRARLMFEVMLLSGITARETGDKNYAEALMLAAALDPDRELSSSQYSPETIALYGRLKEELSREEAVPLSLEGKPADAVVKLDGKEFSLAGQGGGHPVRPGKHFVGAMAPGYEPWSMVLDVRQFEPAGVKFELVPTGPEGDPHAFFLERLNKGDIDYLILLAEKLDVDYLLIPDPQEKKLQAWLIDSTGHTVDHAVLWETGGRRETGAARISDLLDPLRQQLDQSRVTAGAPLNLPDMDSALPGDTDAGKGSSAWTKYAVAIGVILLIGAASNTDSGGGTRIEAAW